MYEVHFEFVYMIIPNQLFKNVYIADNLSWTESSYCNLHQHDSVVCSQGFNEPPALKLLMKSESGCKTGWRMKMVINAASSVPSSGLLPHAICQWVNVTLRCTHPAARLILYWEGVTLLVLVIQIRLLFNDSQPVHRRVGKDTICAP